MLDWAKLFENFGFPAIMAGALLWLLVVKVGRLEDKIDDLILWLKIHR